MQNESYFTYIKEKSFEDKLRAFGNSVESMTRASYESTYGPPGSRDYYSKEYHGQMERVNWLFKELLSTYDEK